MAEFKIYGDPTQVEVLAIDGLLQQITLKVDDWNYLGSWEEFEFIVSAKTDFNLLKVTYLDENDRVKTAEIIDNKAKFNVTLDDFMSFEIRIESEAGSIKEVSGFNRLYLVDKKILTKFASERFTINGLDLGEYILNVLELPYELPSEVIGSLTPIRLGSHSLNTEGLDILNDEIIINLGDIVVPPKYNNSYDFINTETILHLPFTQSIKLDINYVIGYAINIKYIMDLYSGDGTINITSTKTNNVIYSESIKIGRDIPFIRKIGGEKVNTLSTKSGVNNGVLNPFIEVIRNIQYQQNNVFKNEIITNESLKNVTGYVTVNNIILNSGATQNEKNNIVNLLRNGVIIK